MTSRPGSASAAARGYASMPSASSRSLPSSIHSRSTSTSVPRRFDLRRLGGERLAHRRHDNEPAREERLCPRRRHHRRRLRRVPLADPVRPGDELRVETEVLEVRPSKSRPQQGLLKVRTTTFNQRDEVVQVSVGTSSCRAGLADFQQPARRHAMDLGLKGKRHSSPAAPRASVEPSPIPSPMKAPASRSARATGAMSRPRWQR